MIALLAGLATAATLEVCESGCAYARIGDAIAASAPDDEVEVGAGTYAESLTITHSLVIRAVPGANPSILGAQQASLEGAPVIRILGEGVEATWVRLDGLVLSSVNARPVEIVSAKVDITGCYVSSVGVLAGGGALYAHDAVVLIRQSVFDGNRTSGHGGHVRGVRTVVYTTASTFVDGRANLNGGAIYVTGEGSEAVINGGRFERNRAFGNGGALASDGAVMSIDGTRFDGNQARDGGAIWVIGAGLDEPTSVHIVRSTFTENVAESAGGALHASLADVDVERTTFEGNVGGSAGAVMANYGTTLRLYQDWFCKNRATVVGTGAVLYQAAPFATSPPHAWSNNTFIENASSAGPGTVRVSDVEGLVIENNHFLGNRAPGADAAVLAVSGGHVAFTDNLVGWSLGTAIALDPFKESSVTLAHNAWWQNEATYDASAAGVDAFGDVTADPRLRSYTNDGDCGNDDLYHSYFGSLRDAGSPDQQDPDGTRRDIGTFGGANAQADVWNDSDEDGSVNLYDCAAKDPWISPLVTETWYDGVDSDCDGASDFDQDRDGHDSADHGGDDCDDLDPDRSPSTPEIPYDGIDQDCDGVDLIDVDGDGVPGGPTGADCDDLDPDVFPGAPDADDARDRNCDGYTNLTTPLVPKQCATSRGGAGPVALLGLVLLLRRRSTGAP